MQSIKADARNIDRHPVFPIGFGPMRLSLAGRPGESQALRTIHAALDAGATFIDTADCYCATPDEMNHNERLIARALASWGGNKDAVYLGTKGGHVRSDEPGRGGPMPQGFIRDGRPEHIREACEASLRALGVNAIDLYQYHSADPDVPFEDVIGTLADLRKEGKIRAIGLSNVGRKMVSQAQAIAPIATVQNQFSPSVRESAGVVQMCGEMGISFLCWSPLGGVGARSLASAAPAVGKIAEGLGVSPQRVALAWALAQGSHVIPIVGATRPETAMDSLQAATLQLTPQQVAAINKPPA